MSDELFDSADAVEEFKEMMRDPTARQAFVELKAARSQDGTTTRYQHILRLVSETPWAIRPSMLAVIVDLLAFRAAGGRLDPEQISDRIGAVRRPVAAGPSGVAVLPLHGVIVPKASMFSDISGGTSIEGFRGQFREAVAASDVSGIVLDVDSPGGMVDQVPEMAAEIRAARGSKPIVAVANTEAASAAYWLASQADEIVVSKSARVGSIGVFTAHEDRSQQAETEGVKTTLISAGKFKTEGSPFEPLTDEARGHLQSLVDDYYGMFVTDVAKGRGRNVADVRGGFGEGRVLGARDALKTGMADTAGSLEAAVNALLVRAATPSHVLPASPVSFETVPGMYGDDRIGIIAHLPGDDWEQAAIVEAAVDNSAWNGDAAMSRCAKSDDPAAAYKAICAGQRDGDPALQSTWALPHHQNPSDGPNAAGTQAAIQNLPRTNGLNNQAKAKSHLEAHMAEINPDYTPPSGESQEELLQASAELAALAEDPVLSE